MLGWISGLLLKIWGWKVVGDMALNLPKKLYVVVPHTSNWDFPVGLFLNYKYKMDVGYIAKKSLFDSPFGWFFRATRGIPVDRSGKSDLVSTVAEVFKTQEKFCTAIAPEGTRKKVSRLKKGYYYIAKEAQVPIVYVIFEWSTKEVIFLDPKMPEETVDEELAIAHEIFKNAKGYYPELSYGYPFEEA